MMRIIRDDVNDKYSTNVNDNSISSDNKNYDIVNNNNNNNESKTVIGNEGRVITIATVRM